MRTKGGWSTRVRTDSVVNCIALCILQYNYSPSKKHLKAIIKMKMLAPFE